MPATKVAAPIEIELRVRSMRERREISQRELARQAGLSHGYVQKVEAGLVNPTVRQIAALALALDCSPYDLVLYKR